MKTIFKILLILLLSASSAQEVHTPPHYIDGGIDTTYSNVPIPKNSKNTIVNQISAIEYAYNVFKSVGWKNIIVTVFQIAFLVFLSRSILPSLSRKTDLDKRLLEIISNIYDELLEARSGQVLAGKHLEQISNKYSDRLNVDLTIRVLKEIIDCVIFRSVANTYRTHYLNPNEEDDYLFKKIVGDFEVELDSVTVVSKQFKFTGKDDREINLSDLITTVKREKLMDAIRRAWDENDRVDKFASEFEQTLNSFKISLIGELTDS